MTTETGPSGFSGEVVRRAMALGPSDLPADVVEVVRQCVLDWLGVTLAGSREPATAIVLGEVSATAAPVGRGATVIGHAVELSARDAALVNGTASHALDYDDVNQSMLGHPTVPILAGLLATAEVRGATGSELVVAFAAGYEAECSIARALGGEHYQRGFHTTATVGTFGATVACCHLARLDAASAEMALGIAATQAAGLKSMFGTMSKPLHAGLASAAGVLATGLSERGFTAAADSIETVQGFAETHSTTFDPSRGLGEPPAGWYLRSNLFKYHAACYETHSSIEGLRRLVALEHLTPDDVSEVTIHATEAQKRMCAIAEPRTGLEAKFSLRHTAALVLAGRDTSAPATFEDANFADPVVLELREKVRVVFDRVGGGPTTVDLTTNDGRVLHCAHDVSVPERDLDAQRDRLEAKFRALAVPVVGAVVAEQIVGLVAKLDGLADLDELVGAIRA